MAKIFSFASWNVEHFKNDQARASTVANFMKNEGHAPDLFAIFEVVGKDVFGDFTTLMPNYNFYITEGVQYQETLIGVKKGMTAFITQRHKFKAKIPTLRPGVLVTLIINNINYSLLFLHVKSLPDPHGWGLRTDMLEHSINLKKALDKIAQGDANYIVLGDLNTMGRTVRDADDDITGDQEIERIKKRFRRVNMTIVDKDQSVTWWGGGPINPSNLDHVVASDHLNVRGKTTTKINVLGWPQQSSTTAQLNWINKYSDHALLYGQVNS